MSRAPALPDGRPRIRRERGGRRAAVRRPRQLAAPLPPRPLAGRRRPRLLLLASFVLLAAVIIAFAGAPSGAAGLSAAGRRADRLPPCGCCGSASGSAGTGCGAWASSGPRTRAVGARSSRPYGPAAGAVAGAAPYGAGPGADRRPAGPGEDAAAAATTTTRTSWRARRRSTGRRTRSRPGRRSTGTGSRADVRR